METATLAKRHKQQKPKMQPGYDGQFEAGTRLIQNPYDGKMEDRPFNLRESNARTLKLGPAQTAVYDRLNSLWYDAGLYNQAAMNFMKDPVDGGGLPEALPERAASALIELRKARNHLGVIDWSYVELSCIYRYSYRDVAQWERGRDPTARETDEARVKVRHNINKLTYFWGFAKPEHTLAKLQAYTGPDAKPSDRPDLREHNMQSKRKANPTSA